MKVTKTGKVSTTTTTKRPLTPAEQATLARAERITGLKGVAAIEKALAMHPSVEGKPALKATQAQKEAFVGKLSMSKNGAWKWTPTPRYDRLIQAIAARRGISHDQAATELVSQCLVLQLRAGKAAR